MGKTHPKFLGMGAERLHGRGHDDVTPDSAAACFHAESRRLPRGATVIVVG